MSRRFGPMRPDSPSCGEKCAACQRPFAAGDFTTLVAIGPGDDAEQRQRAREGRPYNAVAVQVHADCAAPEVSR